MDERVYKSIALYYGRMGRYHTVIEICEKAKKDNPNYYNDFSLLAGISFKLCDRTENARMEFLNLHSPEYKVAAELVLSDTAQPENSELCALVLLFLGKTKKCYEICRSLNESISSLCLLGWCELEFKNKTCITYFDKALKIKPKDFEANLGKAKCLELLGDLDKSLDVLNHLTVRFPSSPVPLIEKLNLHLELCDWEQAIDIANRIQTLSVFSIEASKVKVLKAICLDGDFEEATAQIRKLRLDIEKTEKGNSKIYHECCQLVSRISCKNPAILEEIRHFCQQSTQMNPNNCEYLCELAYVTYLQGKLKESIKLYKTAVKLDSSSLIALCGLTYCQLQENLNDGVKQQIELLNELEKESSPLVLYMSALINKHNINSLIEALNKHMKNLESVPFGFNYFYLLDINFILNVIKEILKRLPMNSNSELNKILNLLKPIVHICPGLMDMRLLLAETLFKNGDSTNALTHLRRLSDSTPAQMLIARILFNQNDINGALKSLELALSYNFSVRDHPLYLMITAKQQIQENNYSEAIKLLRNALKKTNEELSGKDKIDIYVQLINVYKTDENLQEANNMLKEALAEFQGTTYEGTLILSQADLDVISGKIDFALETLRNVGPQHSFYLEAKQKMASIYLDYKQDVKRFAACYQEIVEQKPGAESQVLLGDAYMQVQEPEKAVEAYETALKKNPRDSRLIRKVGTALVKTHMFGKAINFYTESSKRDPSLRQDLAELLLRLRQYEKAEALLKQATSAGAHLNENSEMMNRCSLLLLLAKVQNESGNLNGALKSLSEARELQIKIIKRDASNNLLHEKTIAANILRQMAIFTSNQGNLHEAIRFSKESLTYKNDDPESLLTLAKLYLQVGELSQCQTTCNQLLRMDPNNDPACVMMADLAFRRTDYETASVHLQQLLSKQAKFWTALARLIEVMRRGGNLQDIPAYLDKAKLSAGDEAGLAYCQGLYNWYCGDSTQALMYFNRARRDAEWGRQAICSMIEICINSDYSGIGSLDNAEGSEVALRTAERLLSELKPRPVPEEKNMCRLLRCFLLLARRDKQSAENALQELTMMAGDDNSKCTVGITLAISTAYIILKQATRARNQLKRVAKQVWSFEEAEYLEKCWLMLADLYIQSGKYDVASELLRRVLQHNKSCSKAYEYLGLITEKEQLYREASENYKKAWNYSNKYNPAIGYKLAFNLLKAKKYVDAIDVAHQVLLNFPNYPKIQKDILEKARNNLRT